MSTTNLSIYNFSTDQIQEFETLTRQFIIPDPNEELTHIYEMDKLVNLIGIRAEKYDSPEFSQELQQSQQLNSQTNPKPPSESSLALSSQALSSQALSSQSLISQAFKIPRNILNPNYTYIYDLLNKIRDKNQSVEIRKSTFELLLNFLKEFRKFEIFGKPKFEFIYPQKLNYIPDVRLIETLDLFLIYLYNKYLFI